MCETCEQLTLVIDELSELLSNAQRNRRRALHELRELQHLVIQDMEEEHEFSS